MMREVRWLARCPGPIPWNNYVHTGMSCCLMPWAKDTRHVLGATSTRAYAITRCRSCESPWLDIFWPADRLSARVGLSEENATAFLDGPSPAEAERYFDSYLASENIAFDDSRVGSTPASPRFPHWPGAE